MARGTAGELRWQGRQRCWQRWSGRRWTEAAYSGDPASLQRDADFRQGRELDDDRRARLLGQVRDEQVLTGATVVDTGPLSVTLARQRPVSHGLHLVLTVLTGGLWVVVWILMTLNRKEDRTRFEVDAWGNVWPVEAG